MRMNMVPETWSRLGGNGNGRTQVMATPHAVFFGYPGGTFKLMPLQSRNIQPLRFAEGVAERFKDRVAQAHVIGDR
jgi:hypothetical protein